MAILRFPAVLFGFVVEHVRRLPGGGFVLRNSAPVATALLLLAFVALVIWGLSKAPQRISLAELAGGGLGPMQSWIIISGDLQPERSTTPTFRYRLTDPAVPDASVIVQSDVELPVGRTTISGQYIGQREPMQEGFKWVGQMRAEAELAQEQPPPWVAVGLAIAGLVVGFADRFSYPMFFGEKPATTARRPMALSVGARRQADGSGAPVTAGTIRMRPGEPVELVTAGSAEPLRIYAAYTSVSPGELRWLSRSDPVLRVKQTTGDLDVVFGARDDRDATFTALEAERRGYPIP